ncbi:hypothetical protein TSUD_13910 [Trifolium subterraneum]|uniref:Uncharacterized protein n=1 Tax=Trifolium subterraneum TaxID=3900 RepID=A0A2Z6NUR7_TRISU|nr:hypothetical protein TSUD_13910 [Trifolium subterraneum]
MEIFSIKIGRLASFNPLEGNNCDDFLAKLGPSSSITRLIHPSPLPGLMHGAPLCKLFWNLVP